jgi:DNA-binding MarR family transcriptional regulator
MRALASSKGVLTPSELAEWTQTERHNITTLVERMKRDGLIRTGRNTRNRRFVNISLTDKGREILMEAMLTAREIVDQIMSSIGDDDALLLEKSLKTMRQNALQGSEYNIENSQPYD